jgi:predicted nucleic-acid-binding protein
MKKNLNTVDTNILVRFLTDDNKTLGQDAKNLFKNAPHESLYLSDVILSETVYVLEKTYGFSRGEIVEKLGSLIAHPVFYLVNSHLINQSLLIYLQSKESFVDAYVASMVKTDMCPKAYTFDENLQKLDKKKIVSPTPKSRKNN